ncbi:Pesticidal crystal protein Cry22Aa [Nymphon striatum]|nr:Pesticidal crystal protein Cry22Aa [Nymphon striatum]
MDMSKKLSNSNNKTAYKTFERKYHWGTSKQNNHVKINGQLIQLWFGGLSATFPTLKIKDAISKLINSSKNHIGILKPLAKGISSIVSARNSKTFKFTIVFVSLTASPVALAVEICETPTIPGQWDLADNATIDIPVKFDVGDVATTAYAATSVKVDITHTYAGDLGGRLISPSGTNIHLWQLGDGTVPPSTASSNCDKGGYSLELRDSGGGAALTNLTENTYCVGTNNDTLTGGTGGTASPYTFNRSNPSDIGIQGIATPITPLSSFVGQAVAGDWQVRISDDFGSDVGTINEVCLNLGFAGIDHEFFASSNSTCSDRLETASFNEGDTIYVCQNVVNKGTETFDITVVSDTSNDIGSDLSALVGSYDIRSTVNASKNVVNTFTAGSGLFPLGSHTFNSSVLVRGTGTHFTGSDTLTAAQTLNVNILDVTPPDAPTINAPALTSDNTPTVTGTAEANSTITIKDENGTTVGTGTADGSGDYSFELSSALSDAVHSLTATATDPSNNTSAASTAASVNVDTTAPVISLIGSNPQAVEIATAYSELGATIVDAESGLTIIIDASAVDTSTAGNYPVTYNVTDSAGNVATTVTRTVVVADTTKPVISLVGANPQTIEAGGSYTELGATIVDHETGLTAVIDASAVDTSTPGDYSVTYNVTDSAGNIADTVTRTVTVADTTKPVISLVGANPQTIEAGGSYTELGATIVDNETGLTVVVDASAVDTSTPGDYSVTYNVTDSAGNVADTVTRTVTTEKTAGVPVVVSLPGDAVEGDTVVINTGTGTPFEVVLSAADITVK